MDDVDRLFQCFKCGVDPPQSALRERKRSKSKSKQGNGVLFDASSIYGGIPSPGSAEPRKKIATDALISDDVQSALRERKRSKSKSKQGNGVLFDASSIYGSSPSPGSAEPRKKIATDALISDDVRLSCLCLDCHRLAVCSRISSLKSKDERYNRLYIRNDSNSTKPPTHLFIDTAVYARNRCFRLALSSKAGKTSILLPTERFKCKTMCEEDMLMASLICNVDSDTDRLLVCKMDMECVKKLHFDTEVNYSVSRPRELSTTNESSRDATMTSSTEGKSPFPSLDKFVECIVSTASTLAKGIRARLGIGARERAAIWFSIRGGDGGDVGITGFLAAADPIDVISVVLGWETG
ncbi:DNA-directed primase/polymerase protein [Linum grandiflorum]